MKDETYAFISDVKEKGSIGRSARCRKTHTGKGGRVRLPSDNLSKKELMKMSGECKSYRLNEPMSWQEFTSMPDDIKVTYIKLLRQKFNVPDTNIASLMGITPMTFSKWMKKLGLSVGRHKRHGGDKWDKEGFWAWSNGVDMPHAPVLEEEPAEAPAQEEQVPVIISEEPETFVEEDLPFEEPDPIPMVEYKPCTATPCNGSMTFKCPANQALNTLAQLLGDANVNISVMWRVVEEGTGDND